ncbi:carbonyl reductase [NADPH] 3-like [Anneissia japonica]|uniref:carbonyl reductase [NADPH] 3-like n=1 Tax=Anneissia japonica TaxID=1529436 RepID=UPI001425A857|nr:carbonyl reductase [NADPH] 3-like [Anneissia japonica]
MTQRIALVTGGNKGIGFAIVRALCKELKDGIVYLTARNEERGKAAVEELKKEGLQPRFHQLDIDSLESIDRLKEFLKSTHGGLDILVNNAGIAFKQNDPAPFNVQAKVTIATNYTGTLNVCHALLPLIRSHGRVCHVASMTGPMAFNKMSPKRQQTFRDAKTEDDVNKLMADFVESAEKGTLSEEGFPQSAYAVSKAGVITLTRVQASAINADSSRQDVLINCCCPGYVDTDLSSHKGTKTVDEGAVTPVYCVMIPKNSNETQGKYLSDKTVVQTWYLFNSYADNEDTPNAKRKDPAPFNVQAKVTIATNYTGTLHACHALIPLIRSHGRVCHVASMSGPMAFNKMNPKRQQTFRDAKTEDEVNKLMADFVESAEKGTLSEEGWPQTAYGVSKAGVVTLTRIQASAINADSSRKDVLINCCCPGYVDTDMTSHKGTKTIDEGAETPVYCVMIPKNSTGPQGKHLSNKTVVQTW